MSPSPGAGLTTTLEKGGPDITDKVAVKPADHSAALSQEAESPVSGTSISARLSSIKISKGTKLRVKILISLVLFASLFIFGKVDLRKAVEVGLKADKGYLLLAVILSLASTFLNAHRWQLLAAAVGLEKGLLKLVQFCFVGLFFNLFLPSTVGGDFSRCYYLSKGTGKYVNAFYSVLADRTVGIAVLFLFASVGILVGPGGGGLPIQLKLPIWLGTLGIFSVVPFMPQLTRRFLGDDNWIARQFNNSCAQAYWSNKGLIFTTVLLSIIMQIVVVACHVLIGLALGLNDIPLWYYFVFYPSVAVLGFITPSFNGIGIREWAYTYFLTMAGVDNAHALTYAIMWLGLNTLSSLVGGLVYILGHFQKPKEESEMMDSAG
ncbi:MAG TPA: lysylphosphatidylglycerol synthase transmembrane domain-containing protein [Candidatus Obscuribacter sp.]|nr:lysylphosphatidylglycerol synthase transmembrane domain-containing protein [Candidatus Obscuribacter sp.]